MKQGSSAAALRAAARQAEAPGMGQAVAAASSRRAWLGVAGCLCTTILGLGLARFAYTPMIPALVAAHWFNANQAALLGAANLAGYLAGALTAAPLARRLGVRRALRFYMLAALASLAACILQAGFGWFFFWRLLSGIAGAGLMVLAAPSVLPLLPQAVRGRAGGVIFLGLGIGMVLSGTALPLLLRDGVEAAWIGIAVAGLLMTVLAWSALPADAGGGAAAGGAAPAGGVAPAGGFGEVRADKPAAARGLAGDGVSGQGSAGHPRALALLVGAYMANAVGQVPCILFLTEYVAHRLNQGVAQGALIWSLFGLGALAGPLAAGAIADRAGLPRTLRLLWASQVVAYLVLASFPQMAAVMPASILAGAGVPAAVVLVFGRSQILAGADADARRRAWAFATSGFALAQAIAGYGFSYALSASQVFWPLYATGAFCMAAAFVLTEMSGRVAEGV